MRGKKVIIVYSLVEESQEITNKELEEEISAELSNVWCPWCKAVEKVKVVEEQD